MDQLSKEKVDIVISSLDAILKAIGSDITVEALLEKQNSFLAMLPKEQHELFMETVRAQTAATISNSVGLAAEAFKQEMAEAIKERKNASSEAESQNLGNA
jgi:uncharacterized membrane protein